VACIRARPVPRIIFYLSRTAWPYRRPPFLKQAAKHAQMPPAGRCTVRLVSSHGDGVAGYGASPAGRKENEEHNDRRRVGARGLGGSLIVEMFS
jgi:hypothetical protein